MTLAMPGPKKRANDTNGASEEPEKKLNKTSSDYDKLKFDFKSKSEEDKECNLKISTWNVDGIPNPPNQRLNQPPRSHWTDISNTNRSLEHPRPQNCGLPEQNGSIHSGGSSGGEFENDKPNGQMSYGGGSGRCSRATGWGNQGYIN